MNNKKILFQKLKIILLITPMILFSIMVYVVGSDAIIEYVGIENSYLFMFIIAFLGGISLFSGIPYPLILITFALGGLNIFYLAAVTATGVMIGDSTSYFIGGRVKGMLQGKIREIFDVLLSVYDNYPQYLVPMFFLYGAFSPFPNDLITLSSGIKNYSFWKMLIPLSAGNFIFCLMLGYFADFFSNYF
ncbi:hypothetical protein N9J72_01130 [Candidatus Gracilibacteria bacterium]|nr:hypothetical protein [Candidatus Gracilibacteria bacterium]